MITYSSVVDSVKTPYSMMFYNQYQHSANGDMDVRHTQLMKNQPTVIA